MSHPRRLLLVLAATAAAATLAACAADTTAPRLRAAAGLPVARDQHGGESDTTLLTAAANAPSIANPVITFTATKGRDTLVKMYYHATKPGAHDSTVFAVFKVPSKALAFRPDGTPILDGQSVTITMTLVDSVHGIIDFQPSGLRFSTKNPAVLRLSFADDDQDLNGDGVVNALDTAITHTFYIGAKETPDSPWTRVPSSVLEEAGEVEGTIFGFTGYAILF
jgi:hypothetical protein